jgi:hypothetical protein
MTLSDLQLMVQIIDMAAEKGLFKGPDLKLVGDLRDRVITFVQTNSKQEETSNDSTSNVAK